MPLLKMQDIVKEFPGVRALNGVSIELEPGEFHAIVGENGAGKSTLMKVLSGVYPAGSFSGEIYVDGRMQSFRGVRDSEAAGIAIIFQELSLVDELTVGENIFLGREPARYGIVDKGRLYQDARKLLRDLHVSIDPRIKAGRLGIAGRQLVEIAKALSHDAKILVLDEPTAALTDTEVDALFEILRKLLDRGVGMIYISHKLEEVFRMSDRITVLRDGRTVSSYRRGEATRDGVISAMVGREVGDIFPHRVHRSGDAALTVSGLTVYAADGRRPILQSASFEVRKGEVLGIAGLMGSGRSEMLTALFGGWPGKVTADEIRIDGTQSRINSPSDAIGAGIAFVTEDRKKFGLILENSVRDNLNLAALQDISGKIFRDEKKENSAARRSIKDLGIKAASPHIAAGALSGGNQQKIVLGKWLLTKPKVLFLDEPTRGVDVGAKQEIYAQINDLAAGGLAIVLVSSELPELMGLSDRILVLNEGKITAEFSAEEATAEKVMSAATQSI